MAIIKAAFVAIHKKLIPTIGENQTFIKGDNVNIFSWLTKEIEQKGIISLLYTDTDGQQCAEIKNDKGEILYKKNILFTCQVIK